MQIVDIQCLRGRNIYCHRPVVKLLVDLEQQYDIPTVDIEDFNDRLVLFLPGISKHCCSLGYEGGFLERLREGTYLAHVTEHIILELQTIAGYDSRYGKTRTWKSPYLYNIIYEFKNEKCALEAARIAVKIVNALIQGQALDVENEIKNMIKVSMEYELGPSTKTIVDEAVKRGIPVTRLGNESLVQLGYGKYQRRIQSTITDSAGCIAVDIASNKLLTKKILQDYDIFVPKGEIAYTDDAAVSLAQELGYPVAVKPYDGNQGKGVALNLTTEEQVRQAFQNACAFSTAVMVERFVRGKDYRVLVVGDKVSAVSERCAACVTGDGVSTVVQLIDEENLNPLRGESHERPLTKLKIDGITKQVLNKQGFTEESVPRQGQTVWLRENGNLSTGGTAADRTDDIHPYNAQMAMKAAQVIGLDVAGIDMITPDISVPLYKNGGAVIEVNAAPGIRMHVYPSAGKPRNVGKDIIDMLFPKDVPYTIPLVSVTGTNGKTTTTRMISHILKTQGLTVGMTTTSGIYINDKCILKGDNTGPASARMVLGDKQVEAAVLETARGGIVKRGLGYDQADVGIITNITEDHLGVDSIDTLEELAFAKSLVVEAIKKDGYAVLNADDAMVLEVIPRVKSRIIYFSKTHDNPVLIKHIKQNGRAVFLKDNMIIIAQGNHMMPVINVKDIPATYQGKVECNIENSLAAVSAAWGLNIPIEVMVPGLKSFSSDLNVNPGRFNLFELDYFKVLVDYGHNIAGYKAVIESAKRLGAERVVGVVGMPGDRLDKHIGMVGQLCGKSFNQIYIKEDGDLRGRKKGEAADLLYQSVLQGGIPKENVDIIYNEVEALNKAMLDARPGDLIVIFFENFEPVVDCINNMSKELEQKKSIEVSMVQQPAG
ncbi:cyanophycin synthetase [Petroclostridium sp. X23]|uniref:cyanophycin synthetase n=1 Tax=Petroclostridium sp. X23 TaxID=3045146 RepID=UPI0024AD12CC|nr:cyanophycin synthetase [Petroclostridium sp. X23]WHH57384.1 cyanophycin synthetase [Petroclostridium sp. X23]